MLVSLADRLLRRPLLRLDLDDRCNLRCDFCPTGVEGNKGRGPFLEAELLPVLDAARDSFWSVYLSCAGEPLLHPKFDRVLPLVGERLGDKDLTLVTNATLLTEKKIRAILDSKVSRITLSVDSLQPGMYESIRKGAKLPKTLANIRNLSRLRGGRRYPKIIMSCILMRENQHELEPFAALAEELRVDCLRFQTLEVIPGTHPDEAPATIDAPVKRKLVKLYFRLLRQGILLDFPFDLSIWKLISVFQNAALHRRKLDYLLYAAGKIQARLGSRCSFVGYEATAKRDGSVFPCTEIPCRPWKAGNGAASLTKWLGDARRRFHRKPFQRCRTCRFHTR